SDGGRIPRPPGRRLDGRRLALPLGLPGTIRARAALRPHRLPGRRRQAMRLSFEGDPREEEGMSLTDELTRIDDELRRAYDGDCWHGPPLRAILAGVTAATAATRHPQLVHSIWALVEHVS